MTQIELEAIKKPSEVVVAFQYVENGLDENSFMTYKIVYTAPPVNYKLSHIDVNSKLAVLEDLDYAVIP